MSKNAIKKIKCICLAMCTGIGAVQLIYAIIWSFRNGCNVQDFYDTSLYLESAVTMLGDGWRLLGYSVLVRFFLGMQKWFGNYYVTVLYVVQAVISLLCFAQGCKTIGELIYHKKVPYIKMLLPALYILTLPVIWQMQFAVLPDALCVAMIVLMFSKIAECLWKYNDLQWPAMLVIFGCLLFISVLHRHYFYSAVLLCGISVLVFIFRGIKKKYRNKNTIVLVCSIILSMAVAFIVSGTVNKQNVRTDSYVRYSTEADLWSMFVYPNIREDYDDYPRCVKEVLSQETVVVYGDHYERYMNYIAIEIQNRAGMEAEQIYQEMLQTGMRLHREELAKGILKEGISYLAFPFAMIKNMYYNGDSLYGHNFIRMYEADPGLTNDYMHIGMNGFGLIAVIGILNYFSAFAEKKEGRKNMIAAALYYTTGIIVIILPLMLFSVVKFDYRFGMVPAFVWGAFALISVLCKTSEE